VRAADLGARDLAFAAGGSAADPNAAPTAEKPRSKLWFNDGAWQTPYYYRVYAVGAGGAYSAPSNVASATTK
jgi:hypothetical protein